MRIISHRLLFVAGCLLATVSGVAASRLDNLLANPPFGQAAAPSQAKGDAPNQPLEFRGFSFERGQQYFSFFDTTTKRTRWVNLNALDDGLLLKSYDEAGRVATVDFNGRALSLTLKSGPKFAQAQPTSITPPGMANAPLPGQTAPLPGMSAKGQNPEAVRLQQIAEEIRRRRALRSQGPQMPLPGQTGAQAGPVQIAPGQGGPAPMPNGQAPQSQGPVPLPGSNSSGGPVPIQVQQ